MAHKVIELTKKFYKEWDDFVANNPQGTLFHTTIWKSIMEEVYSFKHNYKFVIDKEDKISAILPCFKISSLIAGKKLQSVPYNYYGGVLYKDINSGKILLKEYEEQCIKEKLDYFEIKSFNRMEDSLERELRFRYNPHYLLSTLDLTKYYNLNEEELIRTFPRLIKRKIRDLKERGVIIIKRNNEEAIKEFYEMLLELYTKRLRTIPQPFLLFNKIFDKIIRKNLGTILISKYKGESVGGMLLMYFNGHLFDAWSFSSAKHQNLSANYALIYEAIKLGIKRKDRIFDLGVTSPVHSGLLEFKKKWRTDTKYFHTYYYLANKKQMPHFDYYTSMKTLRTFIPLIPKPIIKIVSPIIVKHFS